MGTDNDAQGFKDAKPLHETAVKNFEMSKAPVTVEQYAARGGGKVQNYPRGNAEPTCALAVMDDLREHNSSDLNFKNEQIGEAYWPYAPSPPGARIKAAPG